MKRNQHIGLRHFKWQVFSLIYFIAFSYLLGGVLSIIISLLPDPIEIGSDFSISEEYIRNKAHVLWQNGIKTIFILAILATVLEDLGELLNKLSVISNKVWSVIEGFIPVLMLYATYIGLYKVAYLEWNNSYDQTFALSSDDESAKSYAGVTVVIGIIVFGLRVFLPLMTMDYVSRAYRVLLRLKDNPAYSRLFTLGFGGSASWAHVLDYEKNKVSFSYQDGGLTLKSIFLGKSLFDDDPKPRAIQLNDDAHMLTIGMTGSGKSLTVLYPNLALYKGNIFVFDPKGELAKQTLRRRTGYEWSDETSTIKPGNTTTTFKNGSCYALDPFNETNGDFGDSKFNPLSLIDLDNDRTIGLLNAISDGCIIKSENGDDEHWTEWAKNIIEALIIHVISRYPPENHTLPFVLDLFTGNAPLYYEVPEDQKLDHFSELLVDMSTNDAFGGLIKQVSGQIIKMGDNEKGSVLSTTYRNLRWVGEPAMRRQLSTTNIFGGYNPTTTYVILPSDMISSQVRWVRVLMGVFLFREKEKEQDAYSPSSLFIFDEFGQLGGNLDAITKGFPILRGFNIKLWLITQSISQLKSAFGDRWSDILSASTVQVFGVNDSDTSDWVSKRLGSRVNSEKEKRKWNKASRVVRERVDPLLTPEEVEYMLGKGSNVQIVFPTQGRPMRLERTSYKPINEFKAPPFSMERYFEE